MLFNDFIQTKALESKLPFNLNFEVAPTTEGVETEEVAGFKLPKYNELLSREVWFFELLGSQLGTRRQDLQIQLTLLANELKAKCGLERLGDAMSLLFGNVPEDADPKKKKQLESILDSPQYENFLLQNTQDFQKLAEMSKLVDNDLTLNWLKVSFFLLSRYSGTWTLGETAALTNSRINSLIEFIERETNGGVAPEQPKIKEAEEEEEAGK